MGDESKKLLDILNAIRPCDMNKDYVFISYSNKDRHVVLPDVLELQRRGYNVWLDEKNLDKTQPSWKHQAIDTIEDINCGLLIFYVSKNSLISEPCFNEMAATQSENSKIFHTQTAGLQFIAVEVEPIDNIVDYQEKIHLELLNLLKTGKLDKTVAKNLIVLSKKFVEKFFNGNNERVRIHAKTSDQDEKRYYRDIISSFPQSIKDQVQISEDLDTEDSSLGNTDTADTHSTNTGDGDMDDTDIDVVSDDNTDSGDTEGTGANSDETDNDADSGRRPHKGDIRYTIYGKEYTENQSGMMLRVFAQVLKRHQDKVAGLPDQTGMNCASHTDYTVNKNRGNQMPSYFRVCENFHFDNGESVCIGTAYDIREKLRKIALLLNYCGEDREVFQSDDVELPVVKNKGAKQQPSGGSDVQTADGSVTYTLFGKTYSSNQADMMYTVFEQIIARHPDKLEEIDSALLSVAQTDYTDVPRLERPTYFRAFRPFQIGGTVYSVGTSFGMPDKLKQTARLFAICGEDRGQLQIQGYELPEVGKGGRKKQGKSYMED